MDPSSAYPLSPSISTGLVQGWLETLLWPAAEVLGWLDVWGKRRPLPWLPFSLPGEAGRT